MAFPLGLGRGAERRRDWGFRIRKAFRPLRLSPTGRWLHRRAFDGSGDPSPLASAVCGRDIPDQVDRFVAHVSTPWSPAASGRCWLTVIGDKGGRRVGPERATIADHRPGCLSAICARRRAPTAPRSTSADTPADSGGRNAFGSEPCRVGKSPTALKTRNRAEWTNE